MMNITAFHFNYSTKQITDDHTTTQFCTACSAISFCLLAVYKAQHTIHPYKKFCNLTFVCRFHCKLLCTKQMSCWMVLTYLLLFLHVWQKCTRKLFQFFRQLQSVVQSILNCAFVKAVLQQLQHVCHFCQPAFLQFYT